MVGRKEVFESSAFPVSRIVISRSEVVLQAQSRSEWGCGPGVATGHSSSQCLLIHPAAASSRYGHINAAKLARQFRCVVPAVPLARQRFDPCTERFYVAPAGQSVERTWHGRGGRGARIAR